MSKTYEEILQGLKDAFETNAAAWGDLTGYLKTTQSKSITLQDWNTLIALLGRTDAYIRAMYPLVSGLGDLGTAFKDDVSDIRSDAELARDAAILAKNDAEAARDHIVNTPDATLICQYTMEPWGPIEDLKEGYTNSFSVDCFNRKPVVGDVFYCIGHTRTDERSFAMTARVTDLEKKDGKENAVFEAIEIIPLTHPALVCLYTLGPNCTINGILENYRDSFGVQYFNRLPVVGDVFYCFGQTQQDKVPFAMTAEVTGFSEENGQTYAAFKALDVTLLTHHALVCQYTLEPNSTIDYIKNNYTDSFGEQYFNRTPIVGEVFYCFGLTRIDKIPFAMTAKIIGFTDTGSGRNANFEAIEVVPMVAGSCATEDFVKEYVDGALAAIPLAEEASF